MGLLQCVAVSGCRLSCGGCQLITDSGLLTDDLTDDLIDDLTDELCDCARCSFALRAQEDRTRRHKHLTRLPSSCGRAFDVRRIRSCATNQILFSSDLRGRTIVIKRTTPTRAAKGMQLRAMTLFTEAMELLVAIGRFFNTKPMIV